VAIGELGYSFKMTQDCQIYCTVFDKNYLYQGVTLFRSLQSYSPKFKLYCLALDSESVSALRTLNFPELIVVELSNLNPDQVNWIRPRVTYPQFCWSMQPLICKFVLDAGEPSVTYLESDSCFFSNPQPIFEELRSASVSLAPHFFADEFKDSQGTSGKYCTHFNFFRNDHDGRACLEFWREKNFEYAKEHPNVFPGQTALDYFKEKFKGVVEIENRGAGVAPWNVQQYAVSKKSHQVLINGQPVIFYHFHQLARYQDGKFGLGEYPFSKQTIDYLYIPYIREVLESERMVRAQVPSFDFKRAAPVEPTMLNSAASLNKTAFKRSIHNLIRKIKGVYHVIDPVSLKNKG